MIKPYRKLHIKYQPLKLPLWFDMILKSQMIFRDLSVDVNVKGFLKRKMPKLKRISLFKITLNYAD